MAKFNPKTSAATQEQTQEQSQAQEQTTTNTTGTPEAQQAPQDVPQAIQESGEGQGSAESQEAPKEPVVGEQATLLAQPITLAPPAQEVPKVVIQEAATPVAATATLTDKLTVILKNVPGAYQTDINRILMYVDRMAPKRPVDVKTGVQEQVALYRAIQNIINRQEEHFTPLFSALLWIFKSEATGVMGDRYRMRFMDNVTLHAGDRKAFAMITQTLAILAEPLSRDIALKQVNMERALENGLTAEGRSRVLGYFGI